MQAELITARHQQVLRHQERRRAHARLGHPEQAAPELRDAREKHRRVPVHALLDAHRLDDRDVGLAEKQVGEDEGVRRSLEEPPACHLRSIPPFQRRDEVGDRRSGDATQPLEGALVAGRPVDLDVAVAPVAHDRLDRPLVAHDALVLRAYGAEQRAVHEAEMVAVTVVLGQRLPVRRAAMLHPAGGELDLAGRREIARAIDQPGRRSQMLGERNARVGQHVRALVEGRVAAGVRHAEQLAGDVVGPAVIRAGERPRAAAVGRTHHRAPVHAAVHEDGDVAVLAAHHDDRLGPDATGDEVARARDLAVVADEDPSPAEDPLHLVVEDAWIGVERGVDAIVVHQRRVVDRSVRRGRRHLGYSIIPTPSHPAGRAPRARRTARASPPP